MKSMVAVLCSQQHFLGLRTEARRKFKDNQTIQGDGIGFEVATDCFQKPGGLKLPLDRVEM